MPRQRWKKAGSHENIKLINILKFLSYSYDIPRLCGRVVKMLLSFVTDIWFLITLSSGIKEHSICSFCSTYSHFKPKKQIFQMGSKSTNDLFILDWPGEAEEGRERRLGLLLDVVGLDAGRLTSPAAALVAVLASLTWVRFHDNRLSCNLQVR